MILVDATAEKSVIFFLVLAKEFEATPRVTYDAGSSHVPCIKTAPKRTNYIAHRMQHEHSQHGPLQNDVDPC